MIVPSDPVVYKSAVEDNIINRINDVVDKYKYLYERLSPMLNSYLDETFKSNLRVVLNRLASNQYHDFETQLATPKVIMNADLNALGFYKLAEEVINGTFDD